MVDIYSLLKGKSTSCGCTMCRPKGGKVKSGQQYGYWTVLKADVQKRKSLCRCVCGIEKMVGNQSLTSGHSKSCGCRRAEAQTTAQLRGKQKGQRIMDCIHSHGLTAAYIDRKTNKNSGTGITGVSRFKNGAYRAYITVGRKQIHLGSYAKLDDAITARKGAEEKYFRPLEEKVKKIKREELK
ncbi:hypothetical protein [Megasphaera cerevisiae]|uniref:hypothetical protein n=1 Tax=Megasphaera cerevisiae TaxID=39029 RepID=UPI0009C707DD|nr:hypothetical protein [Megasphaera cerevisiae]SJZ83759.1 hypothetical protein SAMN05660900_01582 [Megasphaera cerevisiae DSM 20462]